MMAVLHFHKRCLLTLIIGLQILIIYLINPMYINSKVYYFFYPSKSIKCYHYSKPTLPIINDEEPPRGKSIFFHETSCNSNIHGKIFIYPRQACAVESAAKMNPDRQIYLLYASPGIFNFTGTQSDRMLQALLSYENIKIRHVDLGEYSRDSPVETLYKEHIIDGSGYAQSHASDILRYLTLWKYGGIYLDLDVVVTKSFEALPENFAGSESARNVAAGVMGFSPFGLGHELAQLCLYDLKENFKGHDWGYNGPGVITRLLKKICGVEEAKDMVTRNCGGFKVLPPKAFYPIRWEDWEKYFVEEYREAVEVASKESYVVHVWNKHSVDLKIPIDSSAPYVNFARLYCPKVFHECLDYF